MKRAEQRKFHYVYKITRLDDSEKYYIGMHSTDELDDNYFGSGQRISRSIKKHGRKKHKKEILEFLPSREALKLREKELITEELRLDKKCMNIAPGGGGGFIDNVHQQRCLDAAVNSRRGVSKTEEEKCKVRLKMIGNKNAATSSRFTGKVCSEEHRRKIGDKNKHLVGERNSQYGSCWVVNDVKPITIKKIKKIELNDYLERGYRLGRK